MKKKVVRDLCSLNEAAQAGPVRTRPARDASLYNAHPLLRDLHHAHTVKLMIILSMYVVAVSVCIRESLYQKLSSLINWEMLCGLD